MKNILCLIILFTTSFSLQAQNEDSSVVNAQTCTLTIQLTELASDQGQLMVGLYNSSSNWLNVNYKGEITKIVDGTATVVFEGIPYGTYAASAIHDEDNNGKLNTGMFGIPSEPYASSRGAKGMFGPPKWEDAKFEVNSSTSSEIIKF